MAEGIWSDGELQRVATLYYGHDETTEAIAARTGVSRSTVSRQLKAARDKGIVRITVATDGGTGSIGRQLADRFGIRAHVVPVRETATDAQRLAQVARTAGRLLSETVTSDMVLGLAWGTTVSTTMEHLVPKATRGTVVVQLNGAVHASSTEVLSVSDLLGRACAAFEARPVFFPVPAFFDDPATKAALWRERSIQTVVDLQRSCHVVVFGVGSWTGSLTSQVYDGTYLDQADMADLEAARAVGDVCTTFYRADGSYADLAINQRSSGPGFDQLKDVPRRLCVSASPARATGTIGALRAGVVTDLVVDEQTAQAVLDLEARQRPLRPARSRDARRSGE
ncbi:sugar-binding transcriptional regulator [uncultured Friedmanniella sp.]|uniref:sugar-binding transcriptional regulator n=1 Tax=uncultured Friedmanniella sp. TaxID=335381 RepID=UPI0035CAA9B7